MEEALKVYREDSMKHQGGGGVEWSVTPGDFWSRGAEPSLLVDRFPNIAMRLRGGAEERGCGYRVKKARIYVQLQLQGTSCSRRVLRTRP